MDFTGLSFEQMKGWGWIQMVHPDDLESNTQSWRHAVETGELFHLQHRCRRADGVYRWHFEPRACDARYNGKDFDVDRIEYRHS